MSIATRGKAPRQSTLFDIWEPKEGNTFEEGWKNKLIWGDNLLVMGSLLDNLLARLTLSTSTRHLRQGQIFPSRRR